MAGGTYIAKTSVQLSADATTFNSVIDKAQGTLKAFGANALKGFGQGSGGVGGMFSGLAGGLSAITGLSTATLGIGAALGAAAGGAALLWSQIKKVGAEADEMHDAADALGATAHGLVGLKIAAGGDEGALDKALSKMVRDIGDLAAGGEAAEKSFAKLGLTMKEMGGVRAEEQFMRIIDAVNKLPTVELQNQALRERFGKSGQQLKELAGKGREFMEERIRRAGMSGIVPDKEFGAANEAMQLAKAERENVVKGARNNLVGKIGAGLTDFVNNNFLTRTFDLAAQAIAPKTGANLAEINAKADAEAAAANKARAADQERKRAEARAAEEAKSIAESQRKFAEEAKTPAQKLQDRSAALDAAAAAGRIATLSDYRALQSQIADEAERMLAATEDTAAAVQRMADQPRALLFGSAADYSFGIEASRSAQQPGGAKDTSKQLDKLTDLDRQQLNELKKLNEKNKPAVRPATF
jgi:hypothetical protein